MRFISYSILSNLVYPKIIKSFPHEKGKLFFTFDDGPNPSVTPYILEILSSYNVKASFFCLGKNVEKYPELFQEIIRQGHFVGNHGYEHLNGWKLSLDEFKKNFDIGFNFTRSSWFRPPYGKLKPSQYTWLKSRCHIIAWNVMSYDFDASLEAQESAKIVKKHASDGSIIVFHDNENAKDKILKILPELIEHFLQKGCLLYSFSSCEYVNKR